MNNRKLSARSFRLCANHVKPVERNGFEVMKAYDIYANTIHEDIKECIKRAYGWFG